MKKILAIIGAGHLGQQIAHYGITDNKYDNVVFFDDFSKEKCINGYTILGNTEKIESEFQKNSFDELIIGIGYKNLNVRKQYYHQFEEKIPFGKIIHSSCWVDETAKINAGCVVYPNCCIDANVSIDANTILNLACTVSHDTVVGKHCFLSPRVALAGFVSIEEQCIIGINSTVIDNLSIVAKTQLGGGTVLIKSIEKPGLYVGNPHKFIR
jgi:sugar O-acyltransferase (sialic acid O-acetyltransferase NeuD family)